MRPPIRTRRRSRRDRHRRSDPRRIVTLLAAVVVSGVGCASASDPDTSAATTATTTTTTTATSTTASITASPSRSASDAPATDAPEISATPGVTAVDLDSVDSVRVAFYYPWFPETWRNATNELMTNFEPVAGFYDSSDPAVVARHLDELAYAHVDVAISSWWGADGPTGRRFDELVDASTGSSVRWTIYYEPEGYADPPADDIVADLSDLTARYAGDDRVFRLDGRLVVFVYGEPTDGCATAARWADVGERLDVDVVLKVFDGYRDCPDQPAGWHQYAPAVLADAQLPWSYSVSPGFWLAGESERLTRDPAGFEFAVGAMVAAQPRFQMITTFNEWGEGTAVEPATAWSSPSGYGVYLDILHEIAPRP